MKASAFYCSHLDLSESSKLIWKEECTLAAEQKAPIVWHLDLGLFNQLRAPIESPAQFSALSLGLKEFSAKVWPEFKQQTAACTLYMGTGDFTAGFEWTPTQKENFNQWLKEASQAPFDPTISNLAPKSHYLVRQFCRDVCIDFLELLQAFLPSELECWVLLDFPHDQTPAEVYHLSSKERYPHTECFFNSPGRRMWEKKEDHLQIFTFDTLSTLGVVIPSKQCVAHEKIKVFDPVFSELGRQKISYRVVNEGYLTEQWEGLDQLIVSSDALSNHGSRALQGFVAAEGKVVPAELPLRL